jgi:hypothetical protein
MFSFKASGHASQSCPVNYKQLSQIERSQTNSLSNARTTSCRLRTELTRQVQNLSQVTPDVELLNCQSIAQSSSLRLPMILEAARKMPRGCVHRWQPTMSYSSTTRSL